MDNFDNRLTEAQYAVRARADLDIEAQYPGEYVAYSDAWNGNELNRRVLAHAPDAEGLQVGLARLTARELATVIVIRTTDPKTRSLPLARVS
jgi:hypothetical protein